VYFKFRFNYVCGICGYGHVELGSGELGDNPPTLPKGTRTLHCELGLSQQVFNFKTNLLETKPVGCFGLMNYRRTEVILFREAELLNKASYTCWEQGVQDNKQAYEAVLKPWWSKLQESSKMHPGTNMPDEFWSDVRKAVIKRRQQLDAQKPKTALEAAALAIQSKSGVEGRTLCAAFDKSTRRFKVGSSGGKYTQIWSRVNGNVVCSNKDERLKPLVEQLNSVAKKVDLGREVWVCAEIDATVKALLDGWNMTNLRWAAKEMQNAQWRDIQACKHCEQWAS
jgi:hypothetical protein